jgi:hypothetical protein
MHKIPKVDKFHYYYSCKMIYVDETKIQLFKFIHTIAPAFAGLFSDQTRAIHGAFV